MLEQGDRNGGRQQQQHGRKEKGIQMHNLSIYMTTNFLDDNSIV
jgi:hypothetical protein